MCEKLSVAVNFSIKAFEEKVTDFALIGHLTIYNFLELQQYNKVRY